LAVFISGILGTHAIETTPITKNCNQRALRALVARSLVTGARLVLHAAHDLVEIKLGWLADFLEVCINEFFFG